MSNRSNSHDSSGSVDVNPFDPNDGFMSHTEEMEKEQKAKDLSNIDSFFVFLENAIRLIESAEKFEPIKRMEVVDELEESFKSIDIRCLGKTGAIITIIIAHVFKTSHEQVYQGSTQQDLSCVFRAANHLINTLPQQKIRDALVASRVQGLSSSIILKYIQANSFNKNFSDEFFQFLTDKTATEQLQIHGEKHSSRNEKMQERDLTPTFSLEELSDQNPEDNATESCTPFNGDAVSKKMNAKKNTTAMTLSEISAICVTKIINSGISFFQRSSPKINQVVPVCDGF